MPFLEAFRAACAEDDRRIEEVTARLNACFRVQLTLTCSACPEQYEAFLTGRRIGYLRLRHGCFRVWHPDIGGEIIFEACPEGDGVFTPSEREGFLLMAILAIEAKESKDAEIPGNN